MRLASLREGRDGALVAVSRDGARMARAEVPTLQEALDDWDAAQPALRAAAAAAAAAEGGEPFDPAGCAAPLPRAAQWLDASAYVNHVELVRRARGARMPESFWTDPLMYQGCPDFMGPHDPIPSREGWGTDFEGEVAVILGDVPVGAGEREAAAAIRLVTLVNDVSLRELIAGELAKGFGFVQSKPASAMAPLAVTPDELPGWTGARLSGPLIVELSGEPFGRADAGQDMTFGFARLIAHAAATRALGAGTVLGSGTVSNRGPDGGPGRPVAEGGRGYSCIAEQRVVETLVEGGAATRFLAPGDRVRIWMEDARGRSLFGAIDQRVVAAEGAAA